MIVGEDNWKSCVDFLQELVYARHIKLIGLIFLVRSLTAATIFFFFELW